MQENHEPQNIFKLVKNIDSKKKSAHNSFLSHYILYALTLELLLIIYIGSYLLFNLWVVVFFSL